jgi:hypothetical protein
MAVRSPATCTIPSNHIRHINATIKSLEEQLFRRQEANFEEAKYVRSHAPEIDIGIITRQTGRRCRPGSTQQVIKTWPWQDSPRLRIYAIYPTIPTTE